jgi:predicted PurR-regulated permease PerM
MSSHPIGGENGKSSPKTNDCTARISHNNNHDNDCTTFFTPVSTQVKLDASTSLLSTPQGSKLYFNDSSIISPLSTASNGTNSSLGSLNLNLKAEIFTTEANSAQKRSNLLQNSTRAFNNPLTTHIETSTNTEISAENINNSENRRDAETTQNNTANNTTYNNMNNSTNTISTSANTSSASFSAGTVETSRILDKSVGSTAENSINEEAEEAKKLRVQKAFVELSSFIIFGLVVLLIYYDYIMLAPHLNSILWALLWSVLLLKPQELLLAGLEWFDSKIRAYQLLLFTLSSAFLIIFCVLFTINNSILALIITISCYLAVIFLLYGKRHSIVSIFLVILTLFIMIFPVLAFLQTCLYESRSLQLQLTQFINNSADFQRFLTEITESGPYKYILHYTARYNIELPRELDQNAIKQFIINNLTSFSEQLQAIFSSFFDILTNLTRIIVSLLTFISTLFYFLENSRRIRAGLALFSPFNADINQTITSTFRKSVVDMFCCSFIVGATHFAVSFASFYCVELEFSLILSFIAGFAAMLPVFSSWIICFPAVIGLLLRGKYIAAVIISATQLGLVYVVDPLIISNFGGDPYLIGMSIVMAVYQFGAIGILVGPLLAALTLTFKDLYNKFINPEKSGETDEPSSQEEGEISDKSSTENGEEHNMSASVLGQQTSVATNTTVSAAAVQNSSHIRTPSMVDVSSVLGSVVETLQLAFAATPTSAANPQQRQTIRKRFNRSQSFTKSPEYLSKPF